MSRRSVVTLLVYAIVLAASAHWLVRHLAVTTDLSAFLPAASTPVQSLLVRQLRDGVASRLILIGIDRVPALRGDRDAPSHGERALTDASRALAHVLGNDQRFAFVANGDPSRLERERNLVAQWRYVLSPAVQAGHFAPDALREALQQSLAMLASPMGPLVRATLPRDPTGEGLRLASLLATEAGPRMVDGVWMSAHGTRALLMTQTRAPGFDLDAQEAAAAAIRSAFASTVASADLVLTLSSPGLLGAESRRSIETDARRASLITLIGVALLLLATYRSVWPLALSAVPALTGLAVGITAVGLAFGAVHAITLGFGAMLIGEAIDYPTYLFANRIRGETLERTQARIGRTLLLAVLTTSCGALAMLLSGFRGLVQLGVLIVVGVIVAGVVTRWVLPLLTPARALEGKQMRVPGWVSLSPRGFAGLRWALAVAVVVASAALVLQRTVLWDDDLSNLNPVSVEAKQRDRLLRGALGAPDVRYLVAVRALDREGALAASEGAGALLQGAIADGAIDGYDSPSRYEPSERTQRSRLEALPDPITLRRDLSRALAELPFRTDAFEPFVEDVAAARAKGPLRRPALEGSALALKVDGLLVADQEAWWALLPLSGVSDATVIRERLAGGTAMLIDLKGEADAMVAAYRERALVTSLIGFGCIALIVAFGVRSFRQTVRLLAPVAAAVVLTAGTFTLAGERLTLFHLVALLLVVGVGVNYALFFGRPPEGLDERNATLLSVLVAASATLCASLALASTGTPVLRAIGLTTALGALYAFACAMAFSRDN